MAHFTADTLARILAGVDQAPAVFVETGTYQGDTTVVALRSGRFRQIHTIELSPVLFERAESRFRGHPEVVLHHGSSSGIVRYLAGIVAEPALFYLDAHWFSPHYGASSEVATGDPFPLWSELESLGRRPWADIVVVDDVHAFGRVDEYTDPRWSGVSPETLTLAFGPHRVRRSEIVDDVFVMWRTPA